MLQRARRLTTTAVVLLGVAGSSTAWGASASRSSSFAYDAGSGLLTQEVVEPNTTALRLQTDYTYDAFGNKTAVSVSGVDIVTRGSSSTFDTKGQFATTNTNALTISHLHPVPSR